MDGEKAGQVEHGRAPHGAEADAADESRERGQKRRPERQSDQEAPVVLGNRAPGGGRGQRASADQAGRGQQRQHRRVVGRLRQEEAERLHDPRHEGRGGRRGPLVQVTERREIVAQEPDQVGQEHGRHHGEPGVGARRQEQPARRPAAQKVKSHGGEQHRRGILHQEAGPGDGAEAQPPDQPVLANCRGGTGRPPPPRTASAPRCG